MTQIKNNADFIHRIEKELEELREKVKRLEKFIDSEKFKELSFMPQHLLLAQLSSMLAYIQILTMRINWHKLND